MRPLFSDRRHLDASHTHRKSRLRAESAFPYPCSDVTLEAAAWAPGTKRFSSPAHDHRKPAQATCWTVFGHPRSCAPNPPRCRTLYPSMIAKIQSCLRQQLPSSLSVTHKHTSLIFQQSLSLKKHQFSLVTAIQLYCHYIFYFSHFSQIHSIIFCPALCSSIISPTSTLTKVVIISLSKSVAIHASLTTSDLFLMFIYLRGQQTMIYGLPTCFDKV